MCLLFIPTGEAGSEAAGGRERGGAHHVPGHDEEMLLFLVQDQIRADGCFLLDGNHRVLLHLPVWAEEHLGAGSHRALLKYKQLKLKT